MCKINTSEIAVVINENGILKSINKEISTKDSDLIERLITLSKSEEATLMDLQNVFAGVDHKSTYFNYCLPNDYRSSFIDGASCPEILTEQEIADRIAAKENEFREHFRKEQEDSEKSGELCNGTEDEYVIEHITDYIQSEKRQFASMSIRYINARNYYETFDKLKCDPETLMLSTEAIGWTIYEYQVTDDIVVVVKSNFGYGRSSYFFVNIRYKGIDILPYSALVKYYYAHMRDLIRHTRSYKLERESWEYAFDFVVETANLASTDADRFVKEWIINEVEEMMSGLYKINNNPDGVIEAMKNKPLSTDNQIYVRAMYANEYQRYKLYTSEFKMTYKAEKISGALLFLEQLSKLEPIYHTVVAKIQEIKSLNAKLIPEVKAMIGKISNDIDKCNDELQSEKSELEKVNIDLKPYETELRQKETVLKEKQKGQGQIYSSVNSFADYRKEYEESHPAYRQLIKRHKDIEDKIKEIELDINIRRDFSNRLETVEQNIETVFGIAA